MNTENIKSIINNYYNELFEIEKYILDNKNSGKKIILTQCDILPYEILHAFDFAVYKIPFIFIKQHSELLKNIIDLADLVVVPEQCNQLKNYENDRFYNLKLYKYFAEDGAVNIHSKIQEILKNFNIKQQYPDEAKLKVSVALYEDIRKTMRAIGSYFFPLFEYSDLKKLFEVAFSIEPQVSLRYLNSIFEIIKNYTAENNNKFNVLIYADDYFDYQILDEINNNQIFIIEDDACNCRRQFDISCNPDSTSIYYELLYAYSFKAYCPALRNANDRFELIYKQIPNVGIDLVVFLDSNIEIRNAHLNNYFENLLLQGISSLKMAEFDFDKITNFIKKLEERTKFQIEITF